mmetsp:Transcript_113922/g.318257  ORF Transcript_113922/g.318257 Transcript_113922/m.318257 type:complete len:333 (-) Transcript_113922:636-1634(-)
MLSGVRSACGCRVLVCTASSRPCTRSNCLKRSAASLARRSSSTLRDAWHDFRPSCRASCCRSRNALSSPTAEASWVIPRCALEMRSRWSADPASRASRSRARSPRKEAEISRHAPILSPFSVATAASSDSRNSSRADRSLDRCCCKALSRAPDSEAACWKCLSQCFARLVISSRSSAASVAGDKRSDACSNLLMRKVASLVARNNALVCLSTFSARAASAASARASRADTRACNSSTFGPNTLRRGSRPSGNDAAPRAPAPPRRRCTRSTHLATSSQTEARAADSASRRSSQLRERPSRSLRSAWSIFVSFSRRPSTDSSACADKSSMLFST